ncbi:MAG: hypothetical protein UW86_C0001G0025 [Microgenomates group bacterium GW2011_GWA1_Microgenomates_45_10]|nr:MAG: hypothetical protein UW69_C0003G0019 [Microgenomates group bacterium GW2011_GWA2_44_7]KKT87472.1 MAG: hypothetical protein UW86_C0001G0025 [Microgenomates group bacterium GW2011_GWA1_Microgenomates_45_10]
MSHQLVKSLIQPRGIETTPKLRRLHPVEASLRLLLRSNNLLCCVSQETKDQIRKTIRNCFVFQQPLTVNITFGSYKGKNVPSRIYANWAEILNVKFMLDTLIKIAEIYPFGVVLEYVLQDILLTELNDISSDDVSRYIESFQEIVSLFQPSLSNIVTIKTIRYGDIVDHHEFKNNISKEIEKIKTEWKLSENQELAKAAIERAKRNLQKVNPSDGEIIESAMFHTAYVRTCFTLDYFETKERIFLVHRKTISGNKPFIPYRSFHSSAVQFWVGEGALVKNGVLKPTILSGKQLGEHNPLYSIENDAFETRNPNLKSIAVYEKTSS